MRTWTGTYGPLAAMEMYVDAVNVLWWYARRERELRAAVPFLYRAHAL